LVDYFFVWPKENVNDYIFHFILRVLDYTHRGR